MEDYDSQKTSVKKDSRHYGDSQGTRSSVYKKQPTATMHTIDRTANPNKSPVRTVGHPTLTPAKQTRPKEVSIDRTSKSIYGQ